MSRIAKALLVVSLTAAIPPGRCVLADGPDDPALVTLSVVDEETGAPIERFRTLPGVPYSGSGSGELSVAVWQPHLVRESTGGRYEWPRERSYETFRLRVEADGYRPTMTAWFRKADGSRDVTIQLRRDPGLRGRVVLADGSPAAGATLAIALPNRTIRLKGRKIDGLDSPASPKLADQWRRPFTVLADRDGQFRLPHETDPAALLVVTHEAGYVEQPFEELLPQKLGATSERRVQLAPWGRIAGRSIWGDRPGAGDRIELIVSHETVYPDMVGTFGSTRSGADGHFEFKDVPPGLVQLSRLVQDPDAKGDTRYQFPVTHIKVRAGGATDVVLGAAGRVVTGRLIGLDSYEGVTLSVHPRAPHFGGPGDQEQWQGWAALQKSPLGATVFRNAIPVGDGGAFRIEGLVPESYQLFVNDSGKKLRGSTAFTVKPTTGGEVQEGPQDVGEVRVTREAQ